MKTPKIEIPMKMSQKEAILQEKKIELMNECFVLLEEIKNEQIKTNKQLQKIYYCLN